MQIKFEVVGTGGGCEAYVAKLPNGWNVVVTDNDDPSLPDENSTAIDVGIYRDEEWMDVVAFNQVEVEAPTKEECERIAANLVAQYIQ